MTIDAPFSQFDKIKLKASLALPDSLAHGAIHTHTHTHTHILTFSHTRTQAQRPKLHYCKLCTHQTKRTIDSIGYRRYRCNGNQAHTHTHSIFYSYTHTYCTDMYDWDYSDMASKGQYQITKGLKSVDYNFCFMRDYLEKKFTYSSCLQGHMT